MLMFFGGERRFGALVEGARRRAALSVAAVALAGGIAAPAAGATSRSQLGQDLKGFWTYVLQTPAPQNPFTTTNNRCHQLGKQVLAPLQPFAPPGVSTTCTVKPGTRVFIGEMSSECSTAEPPPFHGNRPAELRACVRSVLLGPVGTFNHHRLTLDGRRVPLTLVQTPLMRVKLPPDNVLGVPAQRARSVGMGWVALLHPMTPGVHHVAFTFGGTFQGTPLLEHSTVKIIVEPGA